MDLPVVGMRYAIIFAMAVVAAYLGVSLTAFVQLRLNERARVRAQARDGDDADWITSGQDVAPAEMNSVDKWRSPLAPNRAPAQPAYELLPSTIESELQPLRDEVAALRNNIANLNSLARRLSPKYDEAMVLAECGVDERDIAAQCGISAGEAALLLALSDNQRESQLHEK